MIKVTVLYGHPKDAEAFEKYYAETHLPIVARASGISKIELTKFLLNPDGSAPTYYRSADLYFEGTEALQQTMSSAEGQAMTNDLANFATGGVTIAAGQIEN